MLRLRRVESIWPPKPVLSSVRKGPLQAPFTCFWRSPAETASAEVRRLFVPDYRDSACLMISHAECVACWEAAAVHNWACEP